MSFQAASPPTFTRVPRLIRQEKAAMGPESEYLPRKRAGKQAIGQKKENS